MLNTYPNVHSGFSPAGALSGLIGWLLAAVAVAEPGVFRDQDGSSRQSGLKHEKLDYRRPLPGLS